MPHHKFSCPQGVLHVRVSNVHQEVTIEVLRRLFHQFGDCDLLCAYERVVDGMYGVEAYVEFRSRWRAARARAALDGHALYEGCCFLAVDLVPPIYTTITTPDIDELAPAYFFDDTPYAEWAEALDAAERHDEVPASNDELQIVPNIDLTTSMPTNYSTGCPSRDASMESAFTSPAAPPTPMTAGNIAPPVVGGEVLAVDATVFEMPTINHNSEEEVSVAVPLTLGGAPTAFTVLDIDHTIVATYLAPATPTTCSTRGQVFNSSNSRSSEVPKALEVVAPPRSSTEGLDDDTCVVMPVSALGMCLSTIVPHTYFHYIPMPPSDAVLRYAQVKKVIVLQLLHINDSVNITKKQAEEMSNPTLIRDSLLLNSWLLCDRTDFGGSGNPMKMSATGISEMVHYLHCKGPQSISCRPSFECNQGLNVQPSTATLEEDGTSGAEVMTFLRMFLSGRKIQLATLSAAVLYCSGGSTSVYAAIELHGSEHFPWVIAWLGCCITRTLVRNFLGLTLGDDKGHGANKEELFAAVQVHNCDPIIGFHHDKLWDHRGLYFCAWMEFVNCKGIIGVLSEEYWFPLQDMYGSRSLGKPHEGICCSAIRLALHTTSYSAEIYSQVLAEKRSLCCELFAIGMYQPFVQIFAETVHHLLLLGCTSMRTPISQNGEVPCLFRATDREDRFPYIGTSIDQAIRLCLLTDLQMRSSYNFLSDHEQIQWKIAWLFSLVCSVVDNKSHGFTSTEARKLISVPSGSKHLQWEIAWLFTRKTSVLLCEDCPAACVSAGDLHVIMLDAAVQLQSVAPWSQKEFDRGTHVLFLGSSFSDLILLIFAKFDWQIAWSFPSQGFVHISNHGSCFNLVLVYMHEGPFSLELWLTCVAELLGHNSELSIPIVQLHPWSSWELSLWILTLVRIISGTCHMMLMLTLRRTIQEVLTISYPEFSEKCVCWLLPFPHECYRTNNHFPQPTEDVLCIGGLGNNCNCCLLKKICIANGNNLFLLVLLLWNPGDRAIVTTGVWTVQERLHSRTDKCFGVRLVVQQPLQQTWDPGETVLNGVQFVVQVPWDPDGSTLSRLEGKPNFMGEGLSATFPTLLLLGLDSGPLLGHGPAEKPWEATTTNTGGDGNERLGLDRKGFGLGLALRVLVVLLFLSRLCTAHLLPLIPFFLRVSV